MNILDFKDKHVGETCVIIGNGPSLNDTDLSLIEQFTTFGTNRIYKRYTPDYYVCVNKLVAEQFGREIYDAATTLFINEKNCGHFMPSDDSEVFDPDRIVLLNTSEKKPMFQHDLTKPLWEGHTVTYVAMQIACYMGFHKVILVGMDHDYHLMGEPNAEYTMQESSDPGHFDEDYFGQGVRWNFPDLARSAIAYSYAAMEMDIVNCSAYTKLKTFPVLPLNSVINNKPLVSAIVSAYYCKDYLYGCITDLHNQTLVPEIVVVYQEGSPEAEIMATRYYDNQNIVHVVTDDIPTIYEAWNLGVKAASGEFLTNANTDDQHLPMAYEIMSTVLQTNAHLDLVYHDSYITWKYEPVSAFLQRRKEGVKLVGGRVEGEDGVFLWLDYKPSTLVDGCYIGPHPMWRANLHQKHGLFDGRFQIAGDYDFWLRIMEDDNIFFIPEPLGLYMARMEGKELSDHGLSVREKVKAHAFNSCKEVEIRPYNKELSMIKLGKEYLTVTPEGLKDLIDKQFHRRAK